MPPATLTLSESTESPELPASPASAPGMRTNCSHERRTWDAKRRGIGDFGGGLLERARGRGWPPSGPVLSPLARPSPPRSAERKCRAAQSR